MSRGSACSVLAAVWVIACGGTVTSSGDSRDGGGAGGSSTGGSSGSSGFSGSGGSSGKSGSSGSSAFGGSGGIGGSATGGSAGSSTGGVGGLNPGPCQPWETACQIWGCMDLETNIFACGSCTTSCVVGEWCIGGRCVPQTCTAAQTYCSGYGCVDLSTDRSNCGACNRYCEGWSTCVGGVCRCDPPAGECAGVCDDLLTSTTNCGACGAYCGPMITSSDWSYSCDAGVCRCVNGAMACGAFCARDFWYCPAAGSTETPLNVCLQRADSPTEQCACNNCLTLLQECVRSADCIDAVDCTLPSDCGARCAPPPYSACYPRSTSSYHATAADLIDCINAHCR